MMGTADVLCRNTFWRAEERGWQLEDQIRVSELGFGRDDALVLDTLRVVEIRQDSLFPWGRGALMVAGPGRKDW